MSPGTSCKHHAEGAAECPAAQAIHILQDKWVLHIIHALLSGPLGFNELGREVGGCNPTTLTQRLCRLEDLGLVEREVTNETPVRTAYGLTPKGQGLSSVIEAIQLWASQNLVARG